MSSGLRSRSPCSQGIHPRQEPGGIGIGVKCRVQVRYDFDRQSFRHMTERVITGEQVEPCRSCHVPAAVQTRRREGQVNVMRIPAVTIKPRGVVPPRVMNVVAEEIAFPGHFGNMREITDEFQSETGVKCRPRGVGRGQERVGIDRIHGGSVRRDVDRGREIGAPCLDDPVAEGVRERLPETADAVACRLNVLSAESFAVKDLSLPVPCAESKAEAV